MTGNRKRKKAEVKGDAPKTPEAALAFFRHANDGQPAYRHCKPRVEETKDGRRIVRGKVDGRSMAFTFGAGN